MQHNLQLGQQNQWKSSCLDDGLCQEPQWLLCLLLLSWYTVTVFSNEKSEQKCLNFLSIVDYMISK